MIGNKFLSVAGASEPTDAQFNYVTMLLHGDGTNGAQNNTFLDSSTNNFTITRNGNTTQGTFSPYGSNWSNYIDNNTSYLSYGSSSDFTFGTGDFTVEAWIYISAQNSSGFSIFGVGGASTGSYLLYVTLYGTIQSTRYGDGGGDGVTSSTVPIGVWTHVAAVRSSGTAKVYINGVVNAAATYSMGNVTATAGETGRVVQTAQNSQGYVSNLRVCKGTAVYTSNFTPATTPLTSTSQSATNCVLLTCQGNRFVDANTATSAKTVTTSGTPSVQRFQPFLFNTSYTPSTIGGSGYFDGSGDYLTVATSSAFTFGTGDFTVEGWTYIVTSGDDGLFQQGTSYFPSSTTNTVAAGINDSARTWQVYANNTNANSTATWSLNTWYHFAVVRSGTTTTLYINGTSVITVSSDSTNYTGTYFGIGALYGATTAVINAYIANFRVVKGTAVYTGAFTPPTLPLKTSGAASAAAYPNTTNVNTSFAASSCSLLADMTNAGVYDNAMMNDLETVGNAQISTSVKKYGTGSMYFDGSSYLKASPYRATGVSGSFDPIWDFGTGDFTVEAWIYYSTTTRNGSIVSNGGYGFGTADSSGWSLQVYSSGASLGFNTASTQNNFISANSGLVNSTLPNGQWNHIAVTRSGTNLRCFVNGIQVGSTITNSVNCDGGSTYVPKIAADQNGQSSYMLTGYIDDLRITKGYARYTTTFTPPTAALPDKGT